MSSTCPKCGAQRNDSLEFQCGSDMRGNRSYTCIIREQTQTIERLKAAGNDLEIIVLSNAPDLPVVGVVRKAWKEAKGE